MNTNNTTVPEVNISGSGADYFESSSLCDESDDIPGVIHAILVRNGTDLFVNVSGELINLTAVAIDRSNSELSDDTIWILTSTFIIFTMQSGFGLLESGSVSPKNEANIMVKNAMDVIFGGFTNWLFGYAFSFGDTAWDNAFSGWGHFAAKIDGEDMGKLYARFFFQSSFATTATTIVSGSMAERTRLEAYILFSAFNTLVFCFPAHWVWAQTGWLHRMGMIDIAGAGPVHLCGGVTGLVATVMLKPRHERYSSDAAPPMGSPINALLGTFMLWWGWLGFNCGSTYGISGLKWKLAARSAINTLNASIGGGVMATLLTYVFRKRKFDIQYIINGILGSLVSMTAFCALSTPWESFIIGFVGAGVAIAAVALLDRCKVDDPVGCVGVHGVAAIWGLLCVGLFAKEDQLSTSLGYRSQPAGIIYGGQFHLFGVQLLGVVAIAVWSALVSGFLLKMIDLTVGLRLSLEEELLGADIVEHGIGCSRPARRGNQPPSGGVEVGKAGGVQQHVVSGLSNAATAASNEPASIRQTTNDLITCSHEEDNIQHISPVSGTSRSASGSLRDRKRPGKQFSRLFKKTKRNSTYVIKSEDGD